MGRSAFIPRPPTPKPRDPRDPRVPRDPRDPDGPDGDAPTGAPKGWHESSLDLETGLDAFESEWPDDITMPGEFDP
jgi:hypothetical protein